MDKGKGRKLLERHIERWEEIEDMIETYQNMRMMLLGGSGISYDKPHVMVSREDWIQRKAVNLIEYEERIKRKRLQYDKESEALFRLISKLDNQNEREVLSRYYLRHQSASDIGNELKLNRTSVFRIMRRGESNLDQIPR